MLAFQPHGIPARRQSQDPCDSRLGPEAPFDRDVRARQQDRTGRQERQGPPPSRPVDPSRAEHRQQQERQHDGCRQEHPFRAGQVSQCTEPDRQRQPEKPPLTKESDGRPQAECPHEQERALAQDVDHDIADDRVQQHENAGQPGRFFAEEFQGEQISGDDQEHRAEEAQRQCGTLPRRRTGSPEHPVRRNDAERMERMVDSLDDTV